MKRRASAAACLLAALSMCPKFASAAPAAPEKAAAEALFDEGAALVEKGDFASGCEKLAASHELDPALGTLLRLGDCYDRLGKTASAWATFKQALAMARASSQPDREALASERVTDLESRLSRVKLLVEAPAEVDGLQIQLGGVVIPRASWGSPLPVDPGIQKVEASAPGYQPWSTDLDVPAGATSTELAIPPLVHSPASSSSVVAAPPSEPASEPAVRGSGQRTFAYVLGGVGVAALAAGGVFGYLAYDKNKTSLDHCLRDEPNACSPQGKTLRDDAESYATIANIGAGAGAGLLLTSAVLLLTAPSSRTESAASSKAVSLSARVAPGSMKLNLSGAF
jgi:hypothetical protein